MRLGNGLAGVKRLLQSRGMNVRGAIGLLVEIGDMALFETSQQLNQAIEDSHTDAFAETTRVVRPLNQ
jgi:hypothetical protein